MVIMIANDVSTTFPSREEAEKYAKAAGFLIWDEQVYEDGRFLRYHSWRKGQEFGFAPTGSVDIWCLV